MKRLTLAVMVAAIIFLASSPASADPKVNPAITSHSKISRLEKVADKWEGRLRGATTTLGERWNVVWSRKTGVQLFKWDSGIVGLRGGKSNPRIAYTSPRKIDREYFVSYKRSDSKWLAGYSKKF